MEGSARGLVTVDGSFALTSMGCTKHASRRRSVRRFRYLSHGMSDVGLAIFRSDGCAGGN